MNPIPKALRQELSEDEYYKKCCLTGLTRYKIDFHHALCYKGAQINEKWNILPVVWLKHSQEGDTNSIHNCKRTKDIAELIALRRADEKVFVRYAKAKFAQRLKYLEKKYGREGDWNI